MPMLARVGSRSDVDGRSEDCVNGGIRGESCSIRLWEREAYVLEGARTSLNGEVRESKHTVEPGANSTGPCGRPTADRLAMIDMSRY
jgi:hypothetical protein